MKCYEGEVAKDSNGTLVEENKPKVEIECDFGVRICGWAQTTMLAKGTDIFVTAMKCGPPYADCAWRACDNKNEYTVTDDGEIMKVTVRWCCCFGNLCNGSDDAPKRGEPPQSAQSRHESSFGHHTNSNDASTNTVLTLAALVTAAIYELN